MGGQARDNPGQENSSPSPWEGVSNRIQASGTVLSRWHDPGIAVSDGITRDQLVSGEAVRIESNLTLITVAGSIPRRLGGYADDRELALDKKRSRRVQHALRQSLLCWTPKTPETRVSDETARAGAQLEWDSWAIEHALGVEESLRYLTTWAVQNDEQHWGRSVVVNLENELRWVVYALRD